MSRYTPDHSPIQSGPLHAEAEAQWMISHYMQLLSAFLLLLVVAAPLPSAVASLQAPIQYNYRVWQTDDGLPQNSVHAITQTPDGFLWVGTEDGLVRFDGIRFTELGGQAGRLLRHCPISSLKAAYDGSLWIGTTANGLWRLHEGHYDHFTSTNGLPGNEIRCLLIAKTGILWIGTDQGLARWRNVDLQPFHADAPLGDPSISALCEDSKGILRIATRGGLWSLNPAGHLSRDNFGPGPITYPLKATCADREGNVWIGGSGGLRYFAADSLAPVIKSTSLRQQVVSSLMQDSSGQQWVGTYRGVVRLIGDEIVEWPLHQPETGDLIYTLFEDSEANIWLGGRDGLYRLTPARFMNFTTQQGLAANDTISICEDATGAIWAASWLGGLSRISGKTITQIHSTNGLTDDSVMSLQNSRDGGLWVGMDLGRGLNKLNAEFKNIFTNRLKLNNAPIHTIYEDDQGRLWLGTGKGLLVLENSLAKTYATTNGLAGDNVTTLFEDSNRILWVGTSGGISRWSRDHWLDTISTRQGLSHNSVSAIHEDSKHDLWIGTKGGGLNRYRKGQIKAYTMREGLFSNEIFDILEDDYQTLWMSCRKGVFSLPRRQLEDLDLGRIPRLGCTAFGREDGMDTAQCNGIAKPGGWKGADGRLWFATIRGPMAVEPRIKTNMLPPPLAIEEVYADRELLRPASPPLETAGPLTIPAGTREIEIHYTALSFQLPEKNSFKYRLEGIDTDWVSAGRRRVANYHMIRPGNYLFRLQACNNDGVWSAAGQSLPIRVQSYFWQTWWFNPAVALLAGLLIVAFYRFRIARLREIEQLRIQIASDLHDDVGSRLTKVAMVTESLNGQTSANNPAKRHVENISATIRDITLAMDEIVWTINPRNDTLENLANYIFHYAEDYFQDTGIRCLLDLPPELPSHRISTRERHHLFMAVKEALNNILKHAQATEARVALAVTGDWITLSISDNGRGMPDSTPAKIGNGLINMRQRLKEVGGQLQLETRSGAGTKLTLKIRGLWR